MNDKISITYTALVGTTAQLSDNGATRINQDYSLPADGSAHEVDVALTRSTVQALFIICDRNCTVKTNSSGAPDDTITLPANVPIMVGLAGNVPLGTKTAATYFAADITKLFVINTSSPLTAGTFSVRALIT